MANKIEEEILDQNGGINVCKKPQVRLVANNSSSDGYSESIIEKWPRLVSFRELFSDLMSLFRIP